MSHSNNLVRAIAEFSQTFDLVQADEKRLMSIRDSFIENVTAISPLSKEVQTEDPLAEAGQKIEQQISAGVTEWAKTWEAGRVTRELSERFSDRVVFLVFGKVNAGKSSFANFIASTFPGEKVSYFYLENGDIRPTEEDFKEGVTETTARIQGVELGGKLVLLDSPGLYSVTDENGELTRLFTDSADAILWLTPSTSPGQVQELDDLKLELESRKPLLPVITRSDLREEDVDDEGNLVSALVNKSVENRNEQELDVLKRAKEKLGSRTEVRRPLSISVHVYKESDRTQEDLRASGLAEMIDQMVVLIKEAGTYKPSKARQQIINYLEQSVLRHIHAELIPAIENLETVVERETGSLRQIRLRALTALQQELAERVTDWAEELKDTKDKDLLAKRINTLIVDRLTMEIRHSIEHFIGEVNAILVDIRPSDVGNFNDVEVEFERVSGGAMGAGAASVATVVGGAVGAVVGGPVGALIGGFIGGVLGKAGAKGIVETEVVKERVGVDATQAVEMTLKNLDGKLPSIVGGVFDPWEKALSGMKDTADRIRSEISIFEKKLTAEKRDLSDERH